MNDPLNYLLEYYKNYNLDRDVFLYYSKPDKDELLRKSLIALYKVQKGLLPCPWKNK